MPPIIVRILKPKNGQVRAQIRVGAKADPAKALTEFAEEIRTLFGDSPQPGDQVRCEETEKPTPASVRPGYGAAIERAPERSPATPATARRPGPRVPLPNRRQDPRQGHRRPSRPANQPETCELKRTEGEELYFTPEQTDKSDRPLTVDSLKVTDRLLVARPGSNFAPGRDMELVGYAPDVVAMGLAAKPDIDRNPYNFVPWIGGKPTEAQEPKQATHDTIRNDRLSGRVEVTFKAQTPVFVPNGQLQKDDEGAPDTENNTDNTLDFFKCWDGARDRYAIPGASVKGAVRSLFEALTNSRAGVTDDTALGKHPLYRRRSSVLYKILQMPNGPGNPGQVQECAYALCDRDGRPCEKQPHALRRMRSTGYQNNHPQVKEIDWRANLFWVEPDRHRHGQKVKIRFHPRNGATPLPFSQETVDRFLSMKRHPHLADHPDNAAAASRQAYEKRAPKYSQVEQALFRLQGGPDGDIVFGIPKNGELHCFGKNVNFLWPGARSPLAMMGSPGCNDRGAFAACEPENQQLTGSDPAEATFGFAGKHAGKSHPFRGRVRFGTFWESGVTEPMPAEQLMPLTAPSGTKAKARPLYLEPAGDGKSADYDDDAKLRGRKFYWHQQGSDGNIPGVHNLEALGENVPAEWRDKIKDQLPARIRPLPAGTEFTGTLHFTNLTEAELGALLVSVKPDLAFGLESTGSTGSAGSSATDSPDYGIKLGKGKPRGLGSVTASIKLELATPPGERYGSLDAPLVQTKGKEVAHYVTAYKIWCADQYNAPEGRWSNLRMAKALAVLLQIPKGPSARVYPPQFAMYGWLPKLDNADGAPTSRQGKPPAPRPKAMTPAYDLKEP